MLSWKWVWLTLSLSAITWVVVHRGTPADRADDNAATPTYQTGGAAPSSATPTPQALSSAAATTTPTFSLDVIRRIPAPWLDPEPPVENRVPGFEHVEIGDVTGDGENDLVARLSAARNGLNRGDLLVYPVKDGWLGNPVSTPIPMESDGARLEIGDFNEDGKQDILGVGYHTFTVFLSKGDGTFDATVRPMYETEDIAFSATVKPIDANLDGHLDLVFFMSRTWGASPTWESLPRIVVHYGDGLGGFAGTWSRVTSGKSQYDDETAMSMDAGDMNRDGYPDLLIRTTQFDFGAQRHGPTVRIFAGNALGQFGPMLNLSPVMATGGVPASLDYIAFIDYNQDERLDILGTDDGNDMHVWVKLQSPNGQFDTAPVSLATEPSGTKIEVSNLDGDGRSDLLIGHDGWGRVSYYLQEGSNLGAEQMRFVSNDAVTAHLAVGDLDGDGCSDAAISQSYRGLYLMRGTNCKPRMRPQACVTQESIATHQTAPLALGQAPAQPRQMQWSWSTKTDSWIVR